MVRNVASMQNLRDNMDNMSFDTPRRTLYEESNLSTRSPAVTSHSSTSSQPQQHPIVQLCGRDDYTKQLMNRVATGVATEAEQKAFAQQVQRGFPPMTSTPAIQSRQEDKSARFKQATRENAEKSTLR